MKSRNVAVACLLGTLLLLPATSPAQTKAQYVLLFNTVAYLTASPNQPPSLDVASLQSAAKFEKQCVSRCIAARYLIEIKPSKDHTDLDHTIAQLRSLGYKSYIVAGSSDYGSTNLYWDSGAMCWNLQHDAQIKGLYLHEVMSARHGNLTSADWSKIRAFARCATTYHKKIIWEDWAGSTWGWGMLLGQLRNHSSTAYRVINTYKRAFIFQWADNRALRQPDQLQDMLVAQSEVENFGTAAKNPLHYVFPHGLSSQDWLWEEMGGCNGFRGSSQCVPNMPQTVGTALALSDLLNVDSAQGSVGGTYFEFEGWWSASRPIGRNISPITGHARWGNRGIFDPCYYDSISDLVQFMVLFQTGSVPPTPALRASSPCTE